MSSTSPADDHVACRPMPFEHLERTVSPGATSSTCASICDSTTPDGGKRIGRPLRSTMRFEARIRRTPVIARYRSRCPARMRTGTVRCGSTATTPGRRASSCRARVAARLDEVHGDVLPLGVPELRVDQLLDRVGEDEADHQNRDGERDAEDRRRGARTGGG